MEQKVSTFANEFYKSCYILAVATYTPWNGKWIAKAHVYWKHQNEKHLATLPSSEDFDSDWDATSHALAMAHQWADEHMVDLIPSPIKHTQDSE
jgi:hypothetical protein